MELTTPIDAPDGKVAYASRVDSELTCMRIHELALNRWLNQKFILGLGYPVPVIFSTPMDAFSEFDRLFKQASNPYAYLLKPDANGRIIEPYPSIQKYPLTCVSRRGWAFRPSQNYSFHTQRRAGWPTVGKDVTIRDLATVAQRRMPMAWDFTFQVDHLCRRPDHQAFFLEQLFKAFGRSTGGQPQAFLRVIFPTIGVFLARMYLNGEVQDATEKEPNDGPLIFRTTANFTIEGWQQDFDLALVPTLWRLLAGVSGVAPNDLREAFTFDLRDAPVVSPIIGQGGLPS